MLEKVLLIDDDEITLILCKMVMEMNGFAKEIIPLSNGQYGIDFYTDYQKKIKEGAVERPPALIFLDLNMPVMNGWDFLNDFYANYPDLVDQTRVVILSSSIDPEDYKRAMQYSMVIDFVSKPLDNISLEKIKAHEGLQFAIQ